MNKSEFIVEFAHRTGLTKRKASEVTEEFLNILTEEWAACGKVNFPGFGVFEARLTPERPARNPRTKEGVIIPARYRLAFRANKDLLKKVNAEIEAAKK